MKSLVILRILPAVGVLYASTLPLSAADNTSLFQSGITSGQKSWAEDLKRRAERGSAEAEYELGRAYIEGRVFKQNTEEAVKWTRASAAQGFAKGEVNLAVMYYEGKWIPGDYAQSFVWNQKAAAQGDPQGEYNLGVQYVYGQGVKKDVAEGMRWYEKAAEQGHGIAAYNVGVGYSQGLGLPVDEVKGYMWQLLACHFGFEHCKETLRYLDSVVSQAKRAEARSKATEWIKSHPNVKGIPL